MSDLMNRAMAAAPEAAARRLQGLRRRQDRDDDYDGTRPSRMQPAQFAAPFAPSLSRARMRELVQLFDADAAGRALPVPVQVERPVSAPRR